MNRGAAPSWAANIIHTCMGIGPGEKVLVAVDEPLGSVRKALHSEALKAGPAELWTYTIPDASRPFSEFPETYLDLASRMDAVILFLSWLDPVVELPAHIAARAAISRGKARYAVGAYVDQGILENELNADYEQIHALTTSLADRLRGSSSVRVTTPRGTDLRLSVEGREWIADTGLLRGRGVYGNLPAGEVFVAPVEDSAEGVLVVDESLPGFRLDEPVRLVFEAGRVVSIEGEPGASHLERAIRQGDSKPDGEWSRVVAELGIGTNPRARVQGNLMTDEKAMGTIHVAIGRNDMFGGANPAPVHIDCVVCRPTLHVDGERVDLPAGGRASTGWRAAGS